MLTRLPPNMWPFTLQLYVTSPSRISATHYNSAFYIMHILLNVDRLECTQPQVINSNLVDDIMTQSVPRGHWMVPLITALGISPTYCIYIYFVIVALCTIYTHTLIKVVTYIELYIQYTCRHKICVKYIVAMIS